MSNPNHLQPEPVDSNRHTVRTAIIAGLSGVACLTAVSAWAIHGFHAVERHFTKTDIENCIDGIDDLVHTLGEPVELSTGMEGVSDKVVVACALAQDQVVFPQEDVTVVVDEGTLRERAKQLSKEGGFLPTQNEVLDGALCTAVAAILGASACAATYWRPGGSTGQ